MSIPRLSRYTLFAYCVAVAGCSQVPRPSPFQYTPSVRSVPGGKTRPLNSYALLHTFPNGPYDGIYPMSGLTVFAGGTLYGTTSEGGQYGCGTVFRLTSGSNDEVVHSFRCGHTDGQFPQASMIVISGALYGTTYEGGAYGSSTYSYGTAFSVDMGGTEKVLHSFGKGSDGRYLYGSLIDVKGILYGTTLSGGAYGFGTVFSLRKNGKETILHSFGYGSDGAYPNGTLTNVNDTLFGATMSGGSYGSGSGSGEGTVFSITTGGKERVVHSFGGAGDGRVPWSERLVNVSGTLYGTTSKGGGTCDCGTIFSIAATGTTSGTETVLHSFGGAPDGEYPLAGLARGAHDTLYGTTQLGGKYHLGTVFVITTRGKIKILHGFGDGYDGGMPSAPVVFYGNSLVGTTVYGGVYGLGTVFSLSPGP